jgi:GNAT superfamily N-acetyltransferase
MSEIGAIKNAIKAEKQLSKAAKTVTATGRAVDLSKGFNVKGPDGIVIPFRPGTELEKAKTWTKNFYRKDFDVVIAKKPEANGNPKGWEGDEPWSIIRDKKDPGNMMQFSVLEDGSYQIHTARIGEAYRGQGIGAGMYRTLFEKAKGQGAKVSSDSRLSADSFAVWQRFKALGYPIKERPYVKRGSLRTGG